MTRWERCPYHCPGERLVSEVYKMTTSAVKDRLVLVWGSIQRRIIPKLSERS
jgi:hypothetical protein